MKPMHRLLTVALVFGSVPLAARTDDAPVLLAGAEEALVPQGKTPGELARAEGILRAQLAYVASAEGELALARLARNTLKAGAQGAGGVVTFDENAGVCSFNQTQAVNGVVEAVTIRGRFPNGGAILDECSNFGVSALSSPNFLAFNIGAAYTGGAVPRLPELFQLPGTYSSISVSLSGGHQPGYPMSIVAFGPGGIVDSVDLVTSSGWETHTLSGSGISGFVLLGDPLTLVVDDVQYQ
jgi:hypothetical protein